MKCLAIFGLAFLCLNLIDRAADQQAGISGTWILDSEKSDPFPKPVMGLGSSGFDMSSGDIGGDTSGRGGGTLAGRDVSGAARGGGIRSGGVMGMPGSNAPMPSGANPPLVIQQKNGEIEISRTIQANGREVPVFDRYKTDGKESFSTMQVPNTSAEIKTSTKAMLKNNKFVVRTIGYYPQGKRELVREFMLSKDGKTLTLKTTNTNPRGQFVQKQVFHRQ